MSKSINLGEAETQLSDLVDRASNGERFLFHVGGQPVAAIVGPEDLTWLEAPSAERRPRGGIATVGLFADVPEWEAIMEEVLRQREGQMGREVDLE